jgi:nicotinamidase-related amidase
MKTALLVIDVQRGLFESSPAPFEGEPVVQRINLLAERARSAGAPVVFIQHERAESPLAHGSDKWQLDRRLIVQPDDVKVRKSTPDSFLHTELAGLLAGWGAEHLVVCGYATEFCVDTTTRRAAALGFAVTIAADAHTTHDKPHASAETIRTHHNATLPNLTSFGPKIQAVPASDIRF